MPNEEDPTVHTYHEARHTARGALAQADGLAEILRQLQIEEDADPERNHYLDIHQLDLDDYGLHSVHTVLEKSKHGSDANLAWWIARFEKDKEAKGTLAPEERYILEECYAEQRYRRSEDPRPARELLVELLIARRHLKNVEAAINSNHTILNPHLKEKRDGRTD